MATSKASTNDAPRGRGRPRPQEVIDRDEAVYNSLTEPRTKRDIAERTGLDPKTVYLSLWRLHGAERVKLGTSDQARAWERIA